MAVMRSATITGWLVVLSMSGCQSMKSDSTSAPSTAAQGAVPTDAHSQSQSAGPPGAASPPPPAASNGPSRSADAARPITAPPVSPHITSSSAKSKSTAGAQSAKPPGPASSSTPATATVKSSSAPAAATLDLGELETRLKDTNAIGVFTKLSLKNQVDDLLDEFRLFYRGSNKNPTAELRQHYDVLLQKVLSLLRDGDPTLAAAVSSSREAIWGILADPDKFAKL